MLESRVFYLPLFRSYAQQLLLALKIMKKSNIIHAGNIFRKYTDLILQADSQHFPQKPEIFFSFLFFIRFIPQIFVLYFSPNISYLFPKQYLFSQKVRIRQ